MTVPMNSPTGQAPESAPSVSANDEMAGRSGTTPPVAPWVAAAIAAEKYAAEQNAMFAAVDAAVEIAKRQVESRDLVLAEMREFPDNILGDRLDLSVEATCRRIVGGLLAAGWKPGQS